MLTEARAEHEWLAAGSQNVQQQALRDFDQAMRNFYAGTHGRPQRRKRYLNEGFRITDFDFRRHVWRLNRRWGQIWVPKCRLGAVPVDARGPGVQVLPGHPGPRRPLACRIRRQCLSPSRHLARAKLSASTGAWSSLRLFLQARSCTAPA